MNKTPDEIKKGLRLYASELDDIVAVCDMSEAMGLLEEARNKMFEAANCIDEMDSDLSAWGDVASSPGAVEDMARENTELLQKIKQLEQERDAMIESLRKSKACCVCAHRNTRNPNKNAYDITAKCIRCVCGESQFEWRGVCESNGGTP